MKKTLIVLLILSFIGTASVFAQIKLYDATGTTGKSALAEGLDATITLANPNFSTIIVVKCNAHMGQAIYMKEITNNVIVGPSVGIKDNVTWFAPYLSVKLFKKLVILTSWNGIFFGKPSHPDWQINYAFSYQAIDFDLNKLGAKGFYLGYSLLHFMENEPLHLPYVKYEYEINPKERIVFSYTENIHEGKPLFLVGFHHFF